MVSILNHLAVMYFRKLKSLLYALFPGFIVALCGKVSLAYTYVLPSYLDLEPLRVFSLGFLCIFLKRGRGCNFIFLNYLCFVLEWELQYRQKMGGRVFFSFIFFETGLYSSWILLLHSVFVWFSCQCNAGWVGKCSSPFILLKSSILLISFLLSLIDLSIKASGLRIFFVGRFIIKNSIFLRDIELFKFCISSLWVSFCNLC